MFAISSMTLDTGGAQQRLSSSSKLNYQMDSSLEVLVVPLVENELDQQHHHFSPVTAQADHNDRMAARY